MTDSDEISEEDVTFTSDTISLAGSLFLPRRIATPSLCGVIVAGGFGGIRQVSSRPIAEQYALAGYAALTFDYRGFGDSDGSRGKLRPEQQCRDVSAAGTYLSSRPEVDPSRIAVHGSSFGGGIAVGAANRDRRFRSVVCVAGVTDGGRWLRSLRPNWDWLDLCRRLDDDRLRVIGGASSEKVDPRDVAPPDPDSYEYHRDKTLQYPERNFEMTLTCVDSIRQFRPCEDRASITAAPVLCVGVSGDQRVPYDQTISLFNAVQGEKKLVAIENVHHHDIYVEPTLSLVMKEAVAWLQKCGLR